MSLKSVSTYRILLSWHVSSLQLTAAGMVGQRALYVSAESPRELNTPLLTAALLILYSGSGNACAVSVKTDMAKGFGETYSSDI